MNSAMTSNMLILMAPIPGRSGSNPGFSCACRAPCLNGATVQFRCLTLTIETD
jgi:hypothetical protein